MLRFLLSPFPIAIFRRPSNDNPWAECGKIVPSHKVGVYIHLFNHCGPQDPENPKKNPGLTVRPRTTTHGPVSRKNILFQNLHTSLCSGSTLHKNKAWKTIICLWREDWIRKQLSLYTTEDHSAIKLHRWWCHRQTQSWKMQRSDEMEYVCVRDTHIMWHPSS